MRILPIYETDVRIKSLMGVLRDMQDQCLGYKGYRTLRLRRNAQKSKRVA
jgi:hypothetical protein